MYNAIPAFPRRLLKPLCRPAAWVVLIAGGAGLAGCAVLPGQGSPAALSLPDEAPLRIRTAATMDVSPGGDYLVYSASNRADGSQQLYLRDLRGRGGRFLPGTREGDSPFFSPDGTRVGFFAGGRLKTVSLDSGEVRDLVEVADPMGGCWGPDGDIYFADGSIHRIPAGGGTPAEVTRAGEGETHAWPGLLPDGRQLLFNVLQQSRDVPSVAVRHLDTGEQRILLEEGNYPRYAPNGDLIYSIAGELMSVRMDWGRLEIVSEPETLIDGVLLSADTGAAHYGLSRDGTLVYMPGHIFGGARRLVLVGRDGNEQDLGLEPDRYSYARYSPDGEHLAIEIDEIQPQLWLYDLGRGVMTQLVEGGSYPVWTPDGAYVSFTSARSGVPNIFQVPVRRRPAIEQLTYGGHARDHSHAWSPDGEVLAFTETHPDTGMDVRRQQPAQEQRSWPLLATEAEECCPVFSPDGNWLAWVSDTSGHPEVYVQAFPNRGTTYRIDPRGGREPAWSADGRQLYYWQDDRMMAVEVDYEPGFRAGEPQVLFEGVFASSARTWRTRYDITPEGDGFLLIKRGPEESGVTRLRVLHGLD